MASFDAYEDLLAAQLGSPLSDADFTFRFFTATGGTPGVPDVHIPSMDQPNHGTGLTMGYSGEVLTIDGGSNFQSGQYDQAADGLGATVEQVWVELQYDPLGKTVGWAHNSPTTVADGQSLTVDGNIKYEYGRPGGDDLLPDFSDVNSQNWPCSSLLELLSAELQDNTQLTWLRITVTLASGTTESTEVDVSNATFPTGTNNDGDISTVDLQGASLDFDSESITSISRIQYELADQQGGTYIPFHDHQYSDYPNQSEPTVDPPTTVNIQSLLTTF